eukprot:CAMPEP_0178709180 /NCGR_PEP_ID=MMETSP0699-20121125/17068_1 /TAXON_ID=265572 /ORGANISM="Extubocellulus spinifer, Strain CCMP396" /LENGTH=455 /DNA_ID=CAMNT_0020357561 /DNA_START=154 /DNA_END=1520 /DNA_ORIENTATION=+
MVFLKKEATLVLASALYVLSLICTSEASDVSCSGSGAICPLNSFCVDSSVCRECPPGLVEEAGDEGGAAICYFGGLSLEASNECAASCAGGRFALPNCRHPYDACKKGLAWEEVQTAGSEEDGSGYDGGGVVCDFCPSGVKSELSDRFIPLFGAANITCAMADQFFRDYEIDATGASCEAAMAFNYMCGCEGHGYLGADTESKRNAPRLATEGISDNFSHYYLLVIKYGWSDNKIVKYRLWLFGVPILIGLIVALVGIPHYRSIIIWCNNCSTWQLELPIVIVIVMVTVIMLIVCWHVRQQAKATKTYGLRASRCVSRAVFWQSFFYLISFYLTWVPYLALQFSWADSQDYFYRYGLTLFASTMVPLQGFWNSIVYFRLRVKKYLPSLSSISKLPSSAISTRAFTKATSKSTVQNVSSSTPTTQEDRNFGGAKENSRKAFDEEATDDMEDQSDSK